LFALFSCHCYVTVFFGQVAESEVDPFKKISERSWSDLFLELPLEDEHFDNGRLVLQCLAVLPGVYQDEVSLELESAKDPIPQKGKTMSVYFSS